jgi:hypothetical protein
MLLSAAHVAYQEFPTPTRSESGWRAPPLKPSPESRTPSEAHPGRPPRPLPGVTAGDFSPEPDDVPLPHSGRYRNGVPQCVS